MMEKLVSLKYVKEMTTLSQATIYRMMQQGKLPRPFALTPGRKVWRKSEIDEAIMKLIEKAG